MFSESDYSKFEKKVLNRAEEIAREKLQSASSFAEKRLIDAEKEGRNIYSEILTAAKIEAESIKSADITSVDVSFRKQIENREAYIRRELIGFLKKRLDREFPEMLSCFLTWLCENFNDGEIFVNPGFYDTVKLKVKENFNVEKNENVEGILFKSGRAFIEFSTETILEEFKEIVDSEIGKILEV